jgi:Carboxypeptidase regulatory-like domain
MKQPIPFAPVRQQALLSFLALCLVLALSQFAQAQVLYGALVGRVEDPSGAVVPGAKVTVINKATGQQRDITTDDSGAYALRDLQVGVYADSAN